MYLKFLSQNMAFYTFKTELIFNFFYLTALLRCLSALNPPMMLPLRIIEQKKIDIGKWNNIILGGLFPVHTKGTGEDDPCGPILGNKGIQRLEAMLYAVDQINSNRREWGFEVGAIVFDTCSSDSYALERSLQFLQLSCDAANSTSRRVTGVVGAANSAVSESVANIFRLFKIPQVSYASTSEELDILYKYPYFFRVVPSDKFQVQLMLAIINHFGWTFVSGVASEGDYGEKALKKIKDLMLNTSRGDVCFATIEIIPRDPTEEDYSVVIRNLLLYDKARVVIVFLNEEKVSSLLSASKKCEVPPGRFVWLGSDGWGAKSRPVLGNEDIAEGAITLLPKRYPVDGFDRYFKSLKPYRNKRNPWFQEFWENQFNCSLSDVRRRRRHSCSGDEDLGESYRQEGLVPMVIDSVYLLATAIKTLCKIDPEFCNDKNEKGLHYRDLLRDIIANTTINSLQGHNMRISFDSNRNIPVNYTIYQYQRKSKDGNKYVYKVIGEWNPDKRLKMTEDPVWNTEQGLEYFETPESCCSEECEAGEVRIRVHGQSCCWTCSPCINEFYLSDPYNCIPCPEGTLPNEDKSSCGKLEPEYVGKHLDSPWALVPFVFSVLGLSCTLVVFVIFCIHHKTPIIMASGRELCYIILVGIVFCYCFTFVALLKPSEVSCGALRIGMGLGLSTCYSAIFTKTNRISRIFNRSLKITRRPSYISPESQVIICLCLILIQVTLTVLWLIIRPPAVMRRTYHSPRAFVVICGFDGTSVVLALLYNMILIILCTIYAYKTRNIPENFNESKYISFTMYASCIVWLAFIPIYCSALNDYKVQSTILCMSVSVSGTVTLACLFGPKIFIVLFHPEKNVRYPSSATNSANTTCVNSPQVRFVKPVINTSGVQRHPLGSNTRKNSREVFIIANKCVTDPKGKENL